MTNRKNYNSILFLTVYLGLVLVGGNAQVFAHAATNSLFDIRNEIEFKDDLDNKPDDSCAELKAKTDKQDNQFIEDYVKFVLFSIENNSRTAEIDFVRSLQSDAFPSLRKELSEASYQLKSNKYETSFIVGLKTDSVSKKATPFVSFFNQSLKFQHCKTGNFPEKTIYKGTQIAASDSQIFIVTRLPRASIDSLLKK
jgi:hypothetical protein